MVFWLRCRTIPSIHWWPQDSYPYLNPSITMYNNLQLDIIRELGSKELTEGCIIFDTENQIIRWYKVLSYERFDCPISWDSELIRVVSLHRKSEIYEYDSRDKWWMEKIKYIKSQILWHIPHLSPCVTSKALGKWWWFDISEKNISFVDENWFEFCSSDMESPYIEYDHTKPLLEQSEPTLTQLLTLFTHD